MTMPTGQTGRGPTRQSSPNPKTVGGPQSLPSKGDGTDSVLGVGDSDGAIGWGPDNSPNTVKGGGAEPQRDVRGYVAPLGGRTIPSTSNASAGRIRKISPTDPPGAKGVPDSQAAIMRTSTAGTGD